MYKALIDLSGEEVIFALADDKKLIREKSEFMGGRNTANLDSWLAAALKEVGIQLEQISHWTVGAGPGSFTGLRVAAALVAGLCFGGKKNKSRCLPTALGFAANIRDEQKKRVAVLYNGRNHEIMLYGTERQAQDFYPDSRTELLNSENIRQIFTNSHYDAFVAPEADREAIRKVAGDDVCARINFFRQPDVNSMLASSVTAFDNDLTKLVYLRPAVK